MELNIDGSARVPDRQPVAHVVVVGFHAKLGAVVEFAYPRLRGSVHLRSPRFSDTADMAAADAAVLPRPPGEEHAAATPNVEEHEWGSLPDEWNLLPQMALPDGIHEQKADAVFFTLPPAVHCVALFRQSSAAKAVTHSANSKSEDGVAARGSVQKSVVILSRRPIFGAIAERLDLAVRAYFDQCDFSKTGVLVSLYHSLNVSLTRDSFATPSTLYHGLSLRRLVRLLGTDFLRLVKLVLLERRVVIAAKPVRVACNAVVSLASIFPGALDAICPELRPFENISPEDERLGHPLDLFGSSSGVVLQPYAPLPLLNQILAPKRRGCLVGTSRNVAMLLSASLAKGASNGCTQGPLDALIDLTPASGPPSLTFSASGTMSQTVQLSKAEVAFARDLVVAAKAESRNPEASGAMAFNLSDDYIRARLREYIAGFIQSVVACKALRPFFKAAAASKNRESPGQIFNSADTLRKLDLTVLSAYHQPFVRTWLWRTRNSRVWVANVSPTAGSLRGPPEPEMKDDASNLESLMDTTPALAHAHRAASESVEKWASELASHRAYIEMAAASQHAIQGVRGWLRGLETEINNLESPANDSTISVDITSVKERRPQSGSKDPAP